MPDMTFLAEFVKGCTVIELAHMQHEARRVRDLDTLNVVLLELRRREKEGHAQPPR